MPQVQVADPPAGLGNLLIQMNLNFFEFVILCSFWVGVIIISSFISLEGVLSARAPRLTRTTRPVSPFPFPNLRSFRGAPRADLRRPLHVQVSRQ